MNIPIDEYREIIDKAGEGIGVMAPDATIIYANSRLADLFGTKAEDMVGKNIFQYAFGNDRKTYRDLLERWKIQGDIRTDIHIRRKDGREIWIWFSGGWLTDRSGKPMVAVGMVTDISESKKRELELEERASRLKILSDLSFEGVIIHDQGTVVLANEAFSKMSGYALEEIVGKPVFQFVAPESWEIIKQRLVSGDLSTFEVVGRTKDGRTMVGELSVRSITFEGRPCRFVSIHDISRRKQAEMELLEKNNTIQALLDTATESILLFDRNMKVVALNETAARRFGKTREDLIGCSARAMARVLVTPEVARRRFAIMETVFTSGKPVRVEEEREHMVFDSHYFPVFDQNNAVSHIAIFSREITDLKKAEEEIRKSEEKLRTLLDGIHDGVLVTVAGRVVWANPAFVTMVGRSNDQLLGKSVNVFFNPDGKRMVLSHQDALEKNPTSLARWECPVIVSKGSRFEADISMKKIVFEGRPAMLWIFRDITLNKRMNEALQYSESKYRTLVETSPDIIYMLDGKGRILFINEAVRTLGREPGDLIGQPIWRLFHPEDRNLDSIHLRERRTGKRATRDFEVRLLGRDGQVRPALVNSVGIHSMDPETGVRKHQGTFGVIRDISARKRIQTERDLLRTRLTEAERLATLGQFTSSVAHELNNTLDILLTKFYLLEKELCGKIPDSSCRNQVESIRKQLERMGTIARSVLNYQRPRRVVMKPLSLEELLDRTTDLFTDTVLGRIRFLMDVPSKLPKIVGDPMGLEIVLKNVILNAVQSIRNRGEIHIRFRSQDGFLELLVRDTGVGILKKDLKNIFQPFYSTRQPSGGTGLGLVMCKKIIEEHQGSISVSSVRKQGTSVLIRFPISKS